MTSAALKREIEAKLANRIPSALSPMPQSTARLVTCGNGALDALLEGGLPLGAISEVTGPASSGRTSIALALLAAASTEGACAYVDASDTLCPGSAASAGAHLRNVLWVRFGPTGAVVQAGAPLRESHPAASRQVQGSSGHMHPRMESKGMAPALQQVLAQKIERRQRKAEGTPGHPNQPLGLGIASPDQIAWEHFNARKVDESDPLRQLDRLAAAAARPQEPVPASMPKHSFAPQPLDRLERAVRATDQILQSGGFRVVVLDIASVPVQHALRIPAATWFRFRRAAQESDAVLLVLTEEPCARSSAACVLQCTPGRQPAVQRILTLNEYSVAVARQRSGPALGKKNPGRAAAWTAASCWMRAVGQ